MQSGWKPSSGRRLRLQHVECRAGVGRCATVHSSAEGVKCVATRGEDLRIDLERSIGSVLICVYVFVFVCICLFVSVWLCHMIFISDVYL